MGRLISDLGYLWIFGLCCLLLLILDLGCTIDDGFD